MSAPPYATAAMRNSEPILGVLQRELRHCSSVLEIGSGTGQHAVAFAAAMPWLRWQTSDLEENHEQIRATLSAQPRPNVSPPLLLDVRDEDHGRPEYDAIYTANTLHIMSEQSVRRCLSLAGARLAARGRFCCYGPFRRSGAFTTPSNAAFDESLRGRDSDMGIRDLEWVDALAAEAGLVGRRTYAMPANNLMLLWRRS